RGAPQALPGRARPPRAARRRPPLRGHRQRHRPGRGRGGGPLRSLGRGEVRARLRRRGRRGAGPGRHRRPRRRRGDRLDPQRRPDKDELARRGRGDHLIRAFPETTEGPAVPGGAFGRPGTLQPPAARTRAPGSLFLAPNADAAPAPPKAPPSRRAPPDARAVRRTASWSPLPCGRSAAGPLRRAPLRRLDVGPLLVVARCRLVSRIGVADGSAGGQSAAAAAGWLRVPGPRGPHCRCCSTGGLRAVAPSRAAYEPAVRTAGVLVRVLLAGSQGSAKGFVGAGCCGGGPGGRGRTATRVGDLSGLGRVWSLGLLGFLLVKVKG